jgi:hypothetical protein
MACPTTPPQERDAMKRFEPDNDRAALIARAAENFGDSPEQFDELLDFARDHAKKAYDTHLGRAH